MKMISRKGIQQIKYLVRRLLTSLCALEQEIQVSIDFSVTFMAMSSENVNCTQSGSVPNRSLPRWRAGISKHGPGAQKQSKFTER